tara:strand:- start:286 stop:1086 length:801 start_codon:yes stop_codon:yes gene_type:complete
MNWYKIIKFANKIDIAIEKWQQSIREQLEDLVDFSMYRHQNDPQQQYTSEMAKRDLERLNQDTHQNMQRISLNIQEAISHIPNWNNSSILIEARTHDRQNDIGSQNSAEVTVGDSSGVAWGGPASFTYFDIGDRIEVDDILEAGDKDFFVGGSTIESDYFSLVQELKNPGSKMAPGKTLTLYTARPAKDRELYMNATEIPSNIFLTNDSNRASGIAVDFGARDIWQVKIDENNLLQTLDTPFAKDYQVVGGGRIPVKSIVLWSEGS